MKYYLYLLSLLTFVFQSNAQFVGNVPSENEKNYRSMASAPKSITRNVLQDKNGKFWFATWDGIVTYDGKQFANISIKEALGQFRVFSLLEDKAGNLWFGTISAGLYRFDGKSFTHFTTSDGLSHNSILSLFEDHEGNIWLGSETGITKYNGKTFTPFKTSDSPNGNINTIAQDKNGTMWFGTRYGINGDLCCYDGKSFQYLKNKQGLPFANVRSIIEDKSGDIWIGGQNGLICYNGKSFTTISSNFIGNIFEDRAGNLWVSEDGRSKWQLNKYHGKRATEIATNTMFFGVTEDLSGNIWVGAVDGVWRYNGKSIDHLTD